MSWLTDALIKHWESGIKWIQNTSEPPYETSLLRLNSTKAKEFLAWKSQWPIETAIVKTIEWYKNFLKEKNMQEITLAQIDEFQKNFV
mgnify:FL=1